MELEIQSAKLVLSIVDKETGEIITREATLGDFKEVKKTTSTRSKKPKDEDPVAKVTLLEGKIQMNNAAVQMTGWEPEMKIDIKFDKKGRTTTPVMVKADTGNRLTKTYTISCRGSKHDNLAEYGDIFEVIPYEGKEGYFKLKGNAEKEDDIIDVPEEVIDPEKFSDEEDIDDETGVDVSEFDLNLD
jgi:hypothetical protein